MKQNKLKTTLLLAVICMFSYQISAQEGQVTIDQNKDISTLLEYKKDIKTLNLYKIQLDFGSRSEAEALKEKFQNTFAHHNGFAYLYQSALSYLKIPCLSGGGIFAKRC